MVPSGRVIVTGLAAVVLEGGSSRLQRAARRLIGTVALQAVIAACRWRRHGLDFTAWLTSEATQGRDQRTARAGRASRGLAAGPGLACTRTPTSRPVYRARSIGACGVSEPGFGA